MRIPDLIPLQYVWEKPSAVSVSEPLEVAATLQQMDLEKRWNRLQDSVYEYGSYKDDWDGYGSRPLAKSALTAALTYLKHARCTRGMAPNSATLTPDGCIRLEWWSNEDIRQAEFGESGQIEWRQYGPKLKPQQWREHFSSSRQLRGDTWDSVSIQDQGTDVGSAALT